MGIEFQLFLLILESTPFELLDEHITKQIKTDIIQHIIIIYFYQFLFVNVNNQLRVGTLYGYKNWPTLYFFRKLNAAVFLFCYSIVKHYFFVLKSEPMLLCTAWLLCSRRSVYINSTVAAKFRIY